jgi:hypothetical protein
LFCFVSVLPAKKVAGFIKLTFGDAAFRHFKEKCLPNQVVKNLAADVSSEVARAVPWTQPGDTSVSGESRGVAVSSEDDFGDRRGRVGRDHACDTGAADLKSMTELGRSFWRCYQNPPKLGPGTSPGAKTRKEGWQRFILHLTAVGLHRQHGSLGSIPTALQEQVRSLSAGLCANQGHRAMAIVLLLHVLGVAHLE